MHEMTAGDTKYLKVSVVNDNNAPVVISGADITFTLANTVIKTVGSGLTITGASEFVVKLDPNDTKDLLGECAIRVKIVESGTSDVSTVIKDSIIIKK